jgi:flagellar protein FlaI
MALPLLPFPTLDPEDQDDSIFDLVPEPLREAAEEDAHLAYYLRIMPVQQIGVPVYVEKLSRAVKATNVIYPVGEHTYIHVFDDPSDSRNWYCAIEPTMTVDLSDILSELDHVLLDYVEDLADQETNEERREALLALIEKVCIISGPVSGKRTVGKRVRVTQDEYQALRHLIIRDKVGLGPLQPLILDSWVEDISCSGIGPIFIEHKVFKACKSSITFEKSEELDDFVLRLSERIRKPVTFRRPIVDATLPDGSRINIVFGSDVSKRGSNFTIRKFADVPMSILELAKGGSINWTMAAYLSLVIADGMNLFVSGETASGKTTLINAITTFIPPSGKIVTLEDTSELQVPHPNWIRELTREGSQGDGVVMFDLLKAALRQRPNTIMVGEIRGEEGAVAFQAMQTGHQVMATFHAATVEKLIQRVTGHPINVPKAYVDNLNIVVIQSAVRLGTGQIVRRVLSISEIIGYDPSSDAFSYIEIFRWNPITDVFEFVGDKNSFMLEQRVAPKKGIPAHRAREIYDELERRSEFLKDLADQGVTNFYELFKILAKAERENTF